MKKLFLKLLLILSPVLAILGLYVWKDPFKVLYYYDGFYKDKDSTLTYSYNEDYVSIEQFLHNDPMYHYDSYILGGSRSGFFRIGEWEKHIQARASFHFIAAQETLFGIYKKLQFLDKHGSDIKNVLIIMDARMLQGITNSKGYLDIKHPATSGESRLRFQLEFVKAFFDRKFLVSYCDYQLHHKVKLYMRQNGTMTRDYFYYDVKHNETIRTYMDELVTYKKEKYYAKRQYIFYQRDSIRHISPPAIKDTQLAMLTGMSEILRRHNTDCRIIISPLYDQVQFNPADLAILQRLFGYRNVADFSGINDITGSKYNYYENTHYLPSVATRLMDSVYSHH